MYKYLLCWRYLRTRYIALASVVSVMLGRGHDDRGQLGDGRVLGEDAGPAPRGPGRRDRRVVQTSTGSTNSDEVMARIKEVAGDDVEAMAPTMETFGLMKWSFNGQPITRQVQLIGIKPLERAKTGDFAEFLVDERGRKIPPSFDDPRAGQAQQRRPGRCSRTRSDPAMQGGASSRWSSSRRPTRGRSSATRWPTPTSRAEGLLHRPARHAGRPGLPEGGRQAQGQPMTTARSSATSRAG